MTSLDALLNIESDDIADIKSWVNGVVTTDSLDKELKDLVMKLQFVSQDIDKSLDRLQDQLTQSLPSLKQVLSDISTEAHSLRDDFARINRDVRVIDERNQSVIGNLSSVHSIERDMNLCVDSLSEIHHWEVRIKKVNKLFDERGLESVSKELAQMKSRVEMLKDNMPQLYQQRSVAMAELVDKLENMVIPYLHETFEKKDYRSFRQYAQILTAIEKADEVEKQYILNRLDTMKQLLQHFSHKNKRLNTLNVWFGEFLLNLIQYFQDEYEWSLQIFSTKQQSIDIVSKLIADICDEINMEIKQWISSFLDLNPSSSSMDIDAVPSAAATMAKLVSLFEIFNQFVVSLYDSRLLVNVHDHLQQSPGKRDTLCLIPNITKLISNLLTSYYNSVYLKLERLLLFSIFEPSSLSMTAQIHDETVSLMMPTPIRWIGETQLNELSFLDINERIDDSLSTLCETIMDSHRRCLLISNGSLLRDTCTLYDSFIAEYIENIDQLLGRSPYDSSKMRSPLQIESGDKMERKTSEQSGAPMDEATVNETDDVMQLYSTETTPNPKDLNWIVDLKQAFLLKKKIHSIEQQVGDCIHQILTHFIASIGILCDLENQRTTKDISTPNGSVVFYRIFQSNSELKLLSKFEDITECMALFKKSSLNESKVVHHVDNRVEGILLNIMMQEIKISIHNIHALPVWTEKPRQKSKLLNLPTFHVQPNEYIKKMGTHLLALVHQLESSANEEHHDERMDLMDSMLKDDEQNGDDPVGDENKLNEEEKDAANAQKESDDPSIDSEKWLNLVLNEAVQTLFMEFYKLNGLSLRGSNQMIADLNHLCNVANTLYLEEPEFIYAILSVLNCKLGNSNALKERLTSNTEDESNNKKTDPKLRSSFQRKVATKIAILRGLNVRFV